MLEELFIEGYLDIYKLILDFSNDLELTPNDSIVLIKILDYIKAQKKIVLQRLPSALPRWSAMESFRKILPSSLEAEMISKLWLKNCPVTISHCVMTKAT